MNDEVCLSLCIPTNGIIEWVIPTVDSIYASACDPAQFEVIVTDNGSNTEFEGLMHEYEKRYPNFIYKKTNALLFLNQIESFKLANGKLIKFVNHRMTLLPNALDSLICFVEENDEKKPSVYFSNGFLKQDPVRKECRSFDEYVRTLSYWSSWSAGTAIWKSEFDKMDLSREFNRLFPHTDIVFNNRNNSSYIVDDTPLMRNLPADNTKKGSYDLFYAFAVEYPRIIERLHEDGSITRKTLSYVKKKNRRFVSQLYADYVLRKKPCSYD